jgi:hypothetical protein
MRFRDYLQEARRGMSHTDEVTDTNAGKWIYNATKKGIIGRGDKSMLMIQNVNIMFNPYGEHTFLDDKPWKITGGLTRALSSKDKKLFTSLADKATNFKYNYGRIDMDLWESDVP